jgi:hypothetical protein
MDWSLLDWIFRRLDTRSDRGSDEQGGQGAHDRDAGHDKRVFRCRLPRLLRPMSFASHLEKVLPSPDEAQTHRTTVFLRAFGRPVTAAQSADREFTRACGDRTPNPLAPLCTTFPSPDLKAYDLMHLVTRGRDGTSLGWRAYERGTLGGYARAWMHRRPADNTMPGLDPRKHCIGPQATRPNEIKVCLRHDRELEIGRVIALITHGG